MECRNLTVKGRVWVTSRWLRPIPALGILNGTGGGRHGVFIIPKGESEKNVHETQKPIRLMTELVRLFTNHGETVLDPFMGSASTGVACVKLQRKFIGIEMDEKYFDASCKRIEEAYKQGDFFHESPKPIQEKLI
jgi:site-specific DNA-methyltransferase (adenine-specific)